MGVDLLLFQCFISGEFARMSLIEGLAHDNHNSDEGLLHPLCGG
jgi:hypothetical protein